MEKKVYKIQGFRLTQGEMTLGQDKALIRLMSNNEYGMPNVEEMKNIKDVLSLLLESDLAERFLSIILNGETDKVNYEAITNSELEAIVTDFLELNAGWIGRLGDWLRSLESGASTSSATGGSGKN